MAGFNVNVRVYLTHNPLVAMESAYGVDSHFDWERQKKVLMECYERVKHVLDDVPEPLLVWPSFNSRSPSLASNSGSNASGPVTQVNFQTPLQNTPEEQRQIAYEVQKANIHVSVLSSRSWFLEKYWALCQQFPESLHAAAGNQSQAPLDTKVGSPLAFAHRYVPGIVLKLFIKRANPFLLVYLEHQQTMQVHTKQRLPKYASNVRVSPKTYLMFFPRFDRFIWNLTA